MCTGVAPGQAYCFIKVLDSENVGLAATAPGGAHGRVRALECITVANEGIRRSMLPRLGHTPERGQDGPW